MRAGRRARVADRGVPQLRGGQVPVVALTETYVFCFASSADATGSDQGSGGNAGGGSTWNLNRTDGQAGAGMCVSTQESLHSSIDLPVRDQLIPFFATPPANEYGVCFAVGDPGSMGVMTTAARSNPPALGGTSATASTTGYTLPDLPHIGDLVLVHVATRGNVTAATPTDSSGDPYTLVAGPIAGPGGTNQYLWKRVALHNDVAFVVQSTLSGSTQWRLSTLILSTPSSTNVYKMDEHAFTNIGGNPYVYRWTANQHSAPANVYPISCPATQAQSADLSKIVNHVCAASQAQATSVLRVIPRVVATTQAQSASAVRVVSHTCSATQPQSVVVFFIDPAEVRPHGGGGEWVIWRKPDYPGNRPGAWRRPTRSAP